MKTPSPFAASNAKWSRTVLARMVALPFCEQPALSSQPTRHTPHTTHHTKENAPMIYTATYSPEDNKLRLYASARLDAETYGRVKAAGFIWAPKQDLFVAPMWTPSREDLLIELAGEIEDEDRSLVDRAEERADRFSDYKESRIEDAQRAHDAVHRIADN